MKLVVRVIYAHHALTAHEVSKKTNHNKMKTPRDKIVEALERFVGDTKAVKDIFPDATLNSLDEETSYQIFAKAEVNKVIQNLRSQIPHIADEVLKIVVGEVENLLVVDINPSNDDQRIWYRGLGREEAQREMRDKVMRLLTQGTTSTKKEE